MYEIKRSAAVFATSVLAAIVAFCPTLMCAPPEITPVGHSCCPRPERRSQPKQGSLPCDTSSQTCPYLLLQNAKAVTPPLTVPPLQIMAIAVPMERWEHVAVTPSYISQIEDLYLRNRVLLL